MSRLFGPQDTPPTIGLFAVNMEPTLRPRDLAAVAVLAEELGYDSIWVGEHPVLPDPPGRSPFDPRMPLLDPLVTLSYLAGVTSTIELATGILILPLHEPVTLAKRLASLDVLSAGRLMVGYGVGYIEAQYDAIGVPFRQRAAVATEHLAAMRALWHSDAPSFHGAHVSFDHVDAHPRPAQADLRVVAGGHGPLALRRAVTGAHGWYGFFLAPATVELLRDGLLDAEERHERPPGLGALAVSVTPPRGPIDAATVRRYRQAGVDRLVLYPPEGLDVAGLLDFVRDHAPSRLDAVPARS